MDLNKGDRLNTDGSDRCADTEVRPEAEKNSASDRISVVLVGE
jgi:hypothetical protein